MIRGFMSLYGHSRIPQKKLCRRQALICLLYTSVVGVGRGEDRIEPQGFDSQPMQVVEFFGDSVQVPDTVVVAVLETAGIDLIDDRFFPPGFLQGRGWRSEYGHIVQDSVIRSQDKKKEK